MGPVVCRLQFPFPSTWRRRRINLTSLISTTIVVSSVIGSFRWFLSFFCLTPTSNLEESALFVFCRSRPDSPCRDPHVVGPRIGCQDRPPLFFDRLKEGAWGESSGPHPLIERLVVLWSLSMILSCANSGRHCGHGRADGLATLPGRRTVVLCESARPLLGRRLWSSWPWWLVGHVR